MFTLKKARSKICHCSLNQSAMDFENNKRRIIESIEFAKKNGCVLRTGAELEVPGYSCDDHFKEIDLYGHCWETVADILRSGASEGLVIDLGMPVLHRSVSYNCKIIIFNNKIELIRPKMHLADEGNYREKRYFMPYVPLEDFKLEKFYLPEVIKSITGQDFCDLGYANLRFRDALVGLEICEEVWRLNSISRNSYLECDVIICANGSHFEKNKWKTRHGLIQEILQKSNGAYIYCNAIGFDGSAVYFDGGNLVMNKAGTIQTGEYCSMREVNCQAVVIDLYESREDRLGDISHMEEASRNHKIPDIFIDCKFANSQDEVTTKVQSNIFDCVEKQYMLAASSFLWDYIRKSGASGVFLPLSGGADSGVSALIVKFMAERLFTYMKEGAADVIASVRKVVGDPHFSPEKPEDIVKHVLFTAYMGSKNSSEKTRKRAHNLAQFVGCHHSEVEIDEIVKEFEEAVKKVYEVNLKFQTDGGNWAEDIALQNIYARVRMVLSYLFAQVVPLKFKKKGFYLVLSCGNLDETLIGYYTKYDCSSGDINLIGSLSKIDIMATLKYLHTFNGNEQSIKDILDAKPSADLKPSTVDQNDEDEIGLNFREIDAFAQARTERNCSVISFYKMVEGMLPEIDKRDLFNKVKIFFTKYAQNRHKVEVLTTGLHLSGKSCSSKRFDLRPIIYENKFKYELKKLENLIDEAFGQQ